MPSDCYEVYVQYTKFGVDSSSRFPFRARTNRQTDRQTNKPTDATERPTHAGVYAGVGNDSALIYRSNVYYTLFTTDNIEQCWVAYYLNSKYYLNTI